MTEITVSKLFEFGSDSLKLKVLAGENFLDRKINETAMNRPGLALTGFLLICKSAATIFSCH